MVAPKKAVKELQLFVAVRAHESIFKKVGTMKRDARHARMEEAYISEVNECLSGGSHFAASSIWPHVDIPMTNSLQRRWRRSSAARPCGCLPSRASASSKEVP